MRIEILTSNLDHPSHILCVIFHEHIGRSVNITLFKKYGRYYVRMQNIFTTTVTGDAIDFSDPLDMPLWQWELFCERMPTYVQCAFENIEYSSILDDSLCVSVSDIVGPMSILVQKEVAGAQSMQMAYAAFEGATSHWLTVAAQAIETATYE